MYSKMGKLFFSVGPGQTLELNLGTRKKQKKKVILVKSFVRTYFSCKSELFFFIGEVKFICPKKKKNGTKLFPRSVFINWSFV